MTALVKPTSQDLIDITLKGVISPITKQCYARELHRFLAWTDLRPFERSTVMEYRAMLVAEGKSTATINMALAALRKLAEEAHEHGHIDRAEYLGVTGVRSLPRVATRLGRWLTREEIARVIQTVPPTTPMRGQRDRAVLMVMVTAGLRRDEVAGLKVWQYAMRENRPCLIDIHGKGSKLRSIGINKSCSGVLDSWLLASGLSGEDWLFPTIDNPDRLTRRKATGARLYDACVRYCKATGLEFSPHDLRRSFAMWADERGASVEQISRTLGHSSTATTALYMRGPQSLRDAAADKLEDLC